MSSNGFAAPLILESTPSRYLRLLLLLGHGGLLAACWPALPLVWFLPFSLLVLSSLFHCWRHSSRVLRLEWMRDGRWFWCEAGREDVELTLLPDSYLGRWCVVLNFREAVCGRRRSLVLLSDSLTPPTFRRLRARLRLAGSALLAAQSAAR